MGTRRRISPRSTDAPMSKTRKKTPSPFIPRPESADELKGSGPSLAEAPLAHLVRPDRAEEVDLPESGPVHLDEVELGVGELPEEEVRDPLLPARPQDEVRVRQVARVESARGRALVWYAGCKSAHDTRTKVQY